MKPGNSQLVPLSISADVLTEAYLLQDSSEALNEVLEWSLYRLPEHGIFIKELQDIFSCT